MKNKLKVKIISKAGKDSYKVLIERRVRHPLYHKSVLKSRKILVNSSDEHEIGDLITIEETRPISKKVNFRISEKVK